MAGLPDAEAAHMRPFAESFYKSKAWEKTRRMIMQRDVMLCQDCLKDGLITPAEEVHHIVELSPDNINDPNITLNPDNLVSLCRRCHAKRHSGFSVRYKVDEFGRVIPL